MYNFFHSKICRNIYYTSPFNYQQSVIQSSRKMGSLPSISESLNYNLALEKYIVLLPSTQ